MRALRDILGILSTILFSQYATTYVLALIPETSLSSQWGGGRDTKVIGGMRWEHQKPRKSWKGKETAVAGKYGPYTIAWAGSGPPHIPPPPIYPWSGRHDDDDDGEDDDKSRNHFALSGLNAIAGTTTLSSDFDEDEFKARREVGTSVIDICIYIYIYICRLLAASICVS